jgi:hypothetical protein
MQLEILLSLLLSLKENAAIVDMQQTGLRQRLCTERSRLHRMISKQYSIVQNVGDATNLRRGLEDPLTFDWNLLRRLRQSYILEWTYS